MDAIRELEDIIEDWDLDSRRTRLMAWKRNRTDTLGASMTIDNMVMMSLQGNPKGFTSLVSARMDVLRQTLANALWNLPGVVMKRSGLDMHADAHRLDCWLRVIKSEEK